MMAPLADSLAGAVFEMTLESRALGDNHSYTMNSSLTRDQANILQILAVVFSAFSVASAVLAFYWFIKMRRSFRHDLIMLLIQSDMFKALWFMIYPIVTFVSGPVLSSSTFCQVNGFFLAVGIEASDFSILMIAVHSALYIFRPKAAAGEGGLYPYRRFAYIIYLVLPLLLASLAFINENDAYVSDGTYCYLPVRPFWYRLALSWIPRYLIFIVILGIYASIYFYVRYKFKAFAGQGQRDRAPHEESTIDESPFPKPEHRLTLPTTPPLACHGLIPVSRQGTAEVTDAGKDSTSVAEPPRRESFVRRGSVHQFMLMASFTSRVQPQIPTPSSDLSVVDSDSFVGPSTPHPLPRYPDVTPTSPLSAHSMESSIPSQSRDTSWRDGFVRRFSPNSTEAPASKRSAVNIFSILNKRPGDTQTSTPISQLQLTNSRGEQPGDADMFRTRDKIRRQLRFLFIYPLVYIGMWILPFVSHVMQYDDRYAVAPPFILTCLTTICVCMQAAVDCWLFSTREKPWRHIPGTGGGFWESLKFWTGWKGVSKRKIVKGPGKTREEMVKEARSAYQRRDEEMAHRRTQIESAASNNEKDPAPKRGERSWWDASALAGHGDITAMSPVTEENNPFDALVISENSPSKEISSMPDDESTLETCEEPRSTEMHGGMEQSEVEEKKEDQRTARDEKQEEEGYFAIPLKGKD